MSRSAASMDMRRETLFDKHNITIKEEKVGEERFYDKARAHPVIVDFTHAVYVGARVVARATSLRYARRAAHSHIRRIR